MTDVHNKCVAPSAAKERKGLGQIMVHLSNQRRTVEVEINLTLQKRALQTLDAHEPGMTGNLSTLASSIFGRSVDESDLLWINACIAGWVERGLLKPRNPNSALKPPLTPVGQ